MTCPLRIIVDENELRDGLTTASGKTTKPDAGASETSESRRRQERLIRVSRLRLVRIGSTGIAVLQIALMTNDIGRE